MSDRGPVQCPRIQTSRGSSRVQTSRGSSRIGHIQRLPRRLRRVVAGKAGRIRGSLMIRENPRLVNDPRRPAAIRGHVWYRVPP
jgi:hypothetical protein